ncbi:sigma-70 family RNA polymerase sigma factor [Salinibacillus xinjiangensis]|uniref:Sigma-70 family RNA polymerase sigma factor n=1 Tax=Salinibacillus xinjiangensis TaxID=1229268 RepID=A0A6G1XBF4_9BACI|nr:sigma-70 family RNA polymerase sigma factor [Salinibacillus xinjiangensis]MRG88343.1 sigma-70 family RNA polymerase sigma factor [Salinibacillus xinjiangensis]
MEGEDLNDHFTLENDNLLKSKDKESAVYDLMNEYSKQVYLIAYSYVKDQGLAEDIAQEVFLKCYKHLHKYRGDASIKSWIYRITINTSKDFIMKRSFNVFKYSKELFDSLRQSKSVEQIMLEKEESADVLQKVLSLPAKYREVMILYYFQDLKIEEIKDVIKLKANTVKTRLSRGRALLKEKLSDRGECDG